MLEITPRRPLQGVVLAGALAVLAAATVEPPLDVLIGAGVAAMALLVLVRPLTGFVLFTFAVPWTGGYEVSVGVANLALTDILVASIGIAWIVDAALYRRSLLSTRIWTPYLLLFLGAIVLSATQAADWHSSLNEIVKWAELVVVYLAAVRFLDRRDVPVLVAALVLSGVSQAALGYFQFVFGLGPTAFIEHRLFLRAYGSFDQPNPYAGYLNMIIPFALSMSVLGGRWRGWYRAAFVVLVGALFASQSRGAFLAFLLATAVVLAVLFRPARVVVFAGTVVALAGAWLASLGLVPLGPFQKLIDAVGANVSFNNVTNANYSAVERTAHWIAGLRMFSAHPILGVGIGDYSVAYPHFHPRGWYPALGHAHDYYINIAAEAGIIGLTAYILMAGVALWYSYTAIRLTPDRLSYAAILGVLGALVGTDFHNLFDVLYVHGMVALLGLLVALVPIVLRAETRVGGYSGNY